ncbi:MAG TPA: ABC transporter permease [Acidimicrobiales bacterium]
MDKFLALTFAGLCTGGIYAIAASGLVLTYTTTGVFNFAHGAIGMLGAFMYWQLHVHWGMPTWVAFLAVLLVIAPAFGASLELGIMRRLQGTSEATQLVVTVSVLAASLGLAQWLWSPQEAHPLSHFWEGNKISIGPVIVTWHSVFAFILAIAIALGLRLLLFRTRSGITMRATVDDRPLVTLNGGKPDRSALLAWAIGCSLAALAGILAAPDQGLSPVLALLIVNAYAAAVIGRLRSLPLTFLGALILGLADAYGTGYINLQNDYLNGFRSAIPIIILFVALIAMPQSRLRGHSAARSRERMPMPSWGGSLVACGCVVVVTAVITTMITDSNALTLTRVFAVGVIALSLVPLVGYAGNISLCQMSFAGIGAITMAHLGASGSPIGLVWAAFAAGIVGALVALPTLRLSGIYLALATAAFAVVLDEWLFNLPNFNIGPFDVKLFELGSVPVARLHVPLVDPASQKSFLVVLAVVFCVCALLVVAIRRSYFGERLLAMKDSPAACATLGLNLRFTKLAVFALSAAMAGVGGALYGSTLGTVTPDRFSFFESLPLLLLAVVGGIGTAGSALFTGLVLYGIPLVSASVVWFANVGRVLPGAMGIGLGKNPNGVVPDVAEQLSPLRRATGILVALIVAIVGLVIAAKLDLLENWPFAFAVTGVFVAASAVADRRRLLGEDEEPLEWVGVDRAFTSDDVRRLDAELGLEKVAR